MGASKAALSAQSPRNKIPPTLERASDSLRYEASLWQTNLMSLARIRMVASGHLKVYWKKRSISFFIKDVGLACFKLILLIAVYIVASIARAWRRKTPTISCSSSFSAGVRSVIKYYCLLMRPQVCNKKETRTMVNRLPSTGLDIRLCYDDYGTT